MFCIKLFLAFSLVENYGFGFTWNYSAGIWRKPKICTHFKQTVALHKHFILLSQAHRQSANLKYYCSVLKLETPQLIR